MGKLTQQQCLFRGDYFDVLVNKPKTLIEGNSQPKISLLRVDFQLTLRIESKSQNSSGGLDYFYVLFNKSKIRIESKSKQLIE